MLQQLGCFKPFNALQAYDSDFIDHSELYRNRNKMQNLFELQLNEDANLVQLQKENEELLQSICLVDTGQSVKLNSSLYRDMNFWLKICSSDLSNTIYPHVFQLSQLDQFEFEIFTDSEVEEKEETIPNHFDDVSIKHCKNELSYLFHDTTCRKQLKSFINSMMNAEEIQVSYLDSIPEDNNDPPITTGYSY